jgi:hypothetical protein
MNLDLARTVLPDAKQLASLASEDWSESYNLKAERAEICIKDNVTGEIVPIAHILPDCPYDDRMLMIRAPLLVRALLVLLKRAFDEIRKLQKQLPPPKNFAAECAIKCQNDFAFRRYLMERHDLKDGRDAERIKTRVRSILAISSMRELNEDPAAAARWQSLRSNFDAWRRMP